MKNNRKKELGLEPMGGNRYPLTFSVYISLIQALIDFAI